MARAGHTTDTTEPVRTSERADIVSPWVDPKERVVGWRDGIALRSNDIKGILKNEKQARHEYRAVRKAVSKAKSHDFVDPLKGTPPAWQAFASTVMHLDTKAAYNQWQKEKLLKDSKALDNSKKKKKGEDDDEEEDEVDTDEDVEEDITKMSSELRIKKEALQEKQKSEKGWDEKVARARTQDKEEEGQLKKVAKKLELVSYKHGMEVGKHRSSEQYFKYLALDMNKEHAQKIHHLIHSSSIMDMSLSNLKQEVKELIKATNEQEEQMTASHHSTPGSIAGSVRDTEEPLPLL